MRACQSPVDCISSRAWAGWSLCFTLLLSPAQLHGQYYLTNIHWSDLAKRFSNMRGRIRLNHKIFFSTKYPWTFKHTKLLSPTPDDPIGPSYGKDQIRLLHMENPKAGSRDQFSVQGIGLHAQPWLQWAGCWTLSRKCGHPAFCAPCDASVYACLVSQSSRQL